MALEFVNVDFPTNLTVGLVATNFFSSVEVGSPSGLSDVYELGPVYSRLRYTFDASLMEIRGDEMLELKEFFIKYKYKSFRLRDPVEYEVPATAPEQFGTGDTVETDFQLYINFGTFGTDPAKPITKPVDNADFKIYVNGVEQTETTHYTMDYDTGIVSFVSAPGAVPLTWSGIYDIHVRFDVDNINANVSGLRYGNYAGIGLIEEITV